KSGNKTQGRLVAVIGKEAVKLLIGREKLRGTQGIFEDVSRHSSSLDGGSRLLARPCSPKNGRPSGENGDQNQAEDSDGDEDFDQGEAVENVGASERRGA